MPQILLRMFMTLFEPNRIPTAGIIIKTAQKIRSKKPQTKNSSLLLSQYATDLMVRNFHSNAMGNAIKTPPKQPINLSTINLFI